MALHKNEKKKMFFYDDEVSVYCHAFPFYWLGYYVLNVYGSSSKTPVQPFIFGI